MPDLRISKRVNLSQLGAEVGQLVHGGGIVPFGATGFEDGTTELNWHEGNGTPEQIQSVVDAHVPDPWFGIAPHRRKLVEWRARAAEVLDGAEPTQSERDAWLAAVMLELGTGIEPWS